jgi:hypothetical protein
MTNRTCYEKAFPIQHYFLERRLRHHSVARNCDRLDVMTIAALGLDVSSRSRDVASGLDVWFAVSAAIVVTVIGILIVRYRLHWWSKLKPAQGVIERIERIDAGLRYYYSYEANGARFKSHQVISPKSEHAKLQPGDLIPIFLDLSAPKRVRLAS